MISAQLKNEKIRNGTPDISVTEDKEVGTILNLL